MIRMPLHFYQPLRSQLLSTGILCRLLVVGLIMLPQIISTNNNNVCVASAFRQPHVEIGYSFRNIPRHSSPAATFFHSNNHQQENKISSRLRRDRNVPLRMPSLNMAINANGDDLSRGDARGAALLLEGVSVFRGGSGDGKKGATGAQFIVQDIDWRIEPKAKWGLVGGNGVGKSTLLKAITEEIPYDGKITVGTTQAVGYLQQTAVSGSTRSILEEASMAQQHIVKARQELERAQAKVERHQNQQDLTDSSSSLEEDLEALDRATEQYEMVGGYQQEQQVSSMLKGLGFVNLTQPCNELSGGWQMRVSLAKTLLSQPTLCLLDEPSNHLDRSARQWLARYLSNYDGGAMILVTHDVELLQSMDHIAEITQGTMQIYKSCTYAQYLELKDERAKQAWTEYEKNLEKASKLQNFVDKYGASATKASAAQSRVKQIEKMKRQGMLDAPSMSVTQVERFKPSLKLPDPPKSIGETLLSLKNANVGYERSTGPNEQGDNPSTSTVTVPLVSNINLDIMRGMKLLIRGPNGAGKSTILHSLRGSLPLLSGQRIENESLRLGVFTQDLAQELDNTARAVDLVTSYAREGPSGDVFVSDQDARNVLGGLGLSGDKALRPLSALSGGEKARVALAMFALKPSNVYLLDEVSNHLDMECVEALQDALTVWGDDGGGNNNSKMSGAFVVISHDRHFCEKISFTHVATVRDGALVVEQRDCNKNDWDSSGTTSQPTLAGGRGDGVQLAGRDEKVVEVTMDDAMRKKAFNAPKRIAKIEALVMQKEEAISVIDENMLTNGSDVGKLVDLSKQKEALELEVSQLMEEWEELEVLLGQVAV